MASLCDYIIIIALLLQPQRDEISTYVLWMSLFDDTFNSTLITCTVSSYKLTGIIQSTLVNYPDQCTMSTRSEQMQHISTTTTKYSK